MAFAEKKLSKTDDDFIAESKNRETDKNGLHRKNLSENRQYCYR